MNAKQANEDTIYVYSSFKLFCLPVLVFRLVPQLTAKHMFSYLDFRCYFEANGPSVKRTSTFEIYPLKAYLDLLIKLPKALERE